MGLDISHGCWHGAYSAFMRWRTKIASLIGIPLYLMEGFYREGSLRTFHSSGVDVPVPFIVEETEKVLPLRWEDFRPSPLHILIDHSDCDGEIEWKDCAPIAFELEKLLPLLPNEDAGGHIGLWKETTQKFIDGLRLAHNRKENVEFC